MGVRSQLYNTLSKYIGSKCLNICGLLCCCHYCFSCVCKGCNECFECCLTEKEEQHHDNDEDNHYFHEYNNYQFSPKNATKPLNTDYYAKKYQFLPIQSSKDKNMINIKHPTITSPSISSK